MNQPTLSATEILHRRFTITSSDGETLYCDARRPAAATGPVPLIVFVHGFKGFKDWGSIPYINASLAHAGFQTIAFNFSHNGIEGHSSDFTRLDRFARNTFSREVRELREVIDAVVDGSIPESGLVAPGPIGLLGHSRGGGIALLEAARDPRIAAVAVWAAVATFDRYTDRQKQEWRSVGFFETKNMRTGQMMGLDATLLDDIEEHRDALDITAAAATLGRPLLIMHGEQDLSVRIEDGEAIAAHAKPALTRFVRIPHTNHTFGAEHPFAGPNPVLDGALATTTEFFHQSLSPNPQ